MYTILIVDDDESMRVCLEIILARAGYRIITAYDGIDGLAKIHQVRPHLIILDDDMPGLRGSELCHRIKNDPFLRHIPTIMHTSSLKLHNPSYRDYTGADAFLSKPSLPNVIVSQVRNLVEARM